jgi:hypothetical protein
VRVAIAAGIAASVLAMLFAMLDYNLWASVLSVAVLGWTVVAWMLFNRWQWAEEFIREEWANLKKPHQAT